MCDYDKAEIAGEIGPTIYVGGDSSFLKDRVYCVNMSWGSESSNAMVLSRGTKWHLARVPGILVNVSRESKSQQILFPCSLLFRCSILDWGCFKFARCLFKGSMFPCSWKISRGVNKVPFDVCHIAQCTKVRPVLFLSGRTILRADPDLKIGPKLKIVNDIVTSITRKRGKMRLAHMNLSLHGSCKFNKFYLIHANKRRAVQSHYSMSSNCY